MPSPRGEITIILGGRHRILRPSYETIVLTEERLKAGLSRTLNNFIGFNFTLHEVVVIVHTMMIAEPGIPAMTHKELGELILKSGLSRIAKSVGEMILEIIKAGPAETEGSEGNDKTEETSPP